MNAIGRLFACVEAKAVSPLISSNLMEGNRNIVLFDGICNICDGFAKFLFAHDSKKTLFFASQQSPAGSDIIARYGLPTDMKTVFFIEEATGTVFDQSNAVLRIFAHLDAPYSSAYGCMLIPGWIRNFVYRVVAENRYRWFGTHAQCSYSPGFRHQFLQGGWTDTVSRTVKEV